jgi:hypothetical protein
MRRTRLETEAWAQTQSTEPPGVRWPSAPSELDLMSASSGLVDSFCAAKPHPQ